MSATCFSVRPDAMRAARSRSPNDPACVRLAMILSTRPSMSFARVSDSDARPWRICQAYCRDTPNSPARNDAVIPQLFIFERMRAAASPRCLLLMCHPIADCRTALVYGNSFGKLTLTHEGTYRISFRRCEFDGLRGDKTDGEGGETDGRKADWSVRAGMEFGNREKSGG